MKISGKILLFLANLETLYEPITSQEFCHCCAFHKLKLMMQVRDFDIHLYRVILLICRLFSN